jgi:hypothetical protein
MKSFFEIRSDFYENLIFLPFFGIAMLTVIAFALQDSFSQVEIFPFDLELNNLVITLRRKVVILSGLLLLLQVALNILFSFLE